MTICKNCKAPLMPGPQGGFMHAHFGDGSCGKPEPEVERWVCGYCGKMMILDGPCIFCHKDKNQASRESLTQKGLDFLDGKINIPWGCSCGHPQGVHNIKGCKVAGCGCKQHQDELYAQIEREVSGIMPPPDKPTEVKTFSNDVDEIQGLINRVCALEGRMDWVEVITRPLGDKIAEEPDNHIARAIHYPDCWDTAAYPTLAAALYELIPQPFKCTAQPCEITGEQNSPEQQAAIRPMEEGEIECPGCGIVIPVWRQKPKQAAPVVAEPSAIDHSCAVCQACTSWDRNEDGGFMCVGTKDTAPKGCPLYEPAASPADGDTGGA